MSDATIPKDADTVTLSLAELHTLALDVLRHHGVSEPHAQSMARVMVAGQRDACHSHGLFRLLMCVQSLRDGRVSRDAEPQVTQRSPVVVAVDAQAAFSPLAFDLPIAGCSKRCHCAGYVRWKTATNF